VTGGSSRVRRVTGLAAVAVLLLPSSAWADALTPESGGSPNADAIDSLYKLVLYIALAVFVAVEGTLIYSLVAFRARRGRVAAQISGHTRLEVGWTIGAALILVAITAVTFVKLPAITDPATAGPADVSAGTPGVMGPVGHEPSDDGALHIEVRGEQYIWRFRYPGGVVAYGDMVVPTGATVKLDIVSRDVAHSWWVPKLGGKADAIPGYTNHTWFRIARPGVFRGQCAELCGRNHADMITHVQAVSRERFRAWLEAQQRGIDEAHGQVAPGSSPTPVQR
jgi:cytochrome c oxidase subunit II